MTRPTSLFETPLKLMCSWELTASVRSTITLQLRSWTVYSWQVEQMLFKWKHDFNVTSASKAVLAWGKLRKVDRIFNEVNNHRKQNMLNWNRVLRPESGWFYVIDRYFVLGSAIERDVDRGVVWFLLRHLKVNQAYYLYLSLFIIFGNSPCFRFKSNFCEQYLCLIFIIYHCLSLFFIVYHVHHSLSL